MSEQRPAPETSMEEILASIRRIISEDSSAPPPPEARSPVPRPTVMPPPSTEPPPVIGLRATGPIEIESPQPQEPPVMEAAKSLDLPLAPSRAETVMPDWPTPEPTDPPAIQSDLSNQPASKSDELVLTQMVEDDGSVVALERLAPPAAETPAEPKAPPPLDVLLLTDALPVAEPAMDTEPAAMPSPPGTAEPQPVEAPETVSDRPEEKPVRKGSPTVEDLVRQSLEPKIQEWLNANLKELVERLVQREIDSISRRT